LPACLPACLPAVRHCHTGALAFVRKCLAADGP
jgi:hypothetical protein